LTEISLTRKPILKPKPSGKFYMHDFQREDVAYLAEEDSSANWSEMGAMKTTTAEWLMELKTKHIPNPRILVITTKTGKGTYFESLHEVLPEWTVYNVGTDKTTLVIGSKPVPIPVNLPNPLYFRPVFAVAHYHCFTNRACIPEMVKDEDGRPILEEDGTMKMTTPKNMNLLLYHWDAVIVDEAHRMKDPDAQWTRNIKKIKAQFKHVMTGTGFVNNPSEIWSLLNFLYPKHYTSYWKFRERYCEENDWSGYRKIVGIKPDVEEEFKGLVRRVGVRRTMLECFPNIKEPIETVVPIKLNPTQKQMYQEMLEYLHTMDQQGVPLHSPNVLSMLNRLRQICVATPRVKADYYDTMQGRRIIDVELEEPSSKLDATMEIIEGLEWDEERRDQIVVFSNFKGPLKLLEARLARARIPYLRLLAEMNESQRYELWHNTWPKKEHQVFLSTLALGAESINLSAAHRAVFLDQAWSPALNKQAIGRLYRPGQTGAVQLIYVRAENTVDYRVLDAVNEKAGWFKQIFGIGEDDDDES
jgi:SNF2-related domain/Helicase conserved C-terminal domain